MGRAFGELLLWNGNALSHLVGLTKKPGLKPGFLFEEP